MREYKVQVSNGETFTFEGPEDATDDELRQVVQQHLAAQGKSYANAPNTINRPEQPAARTVQDPEQELLGAVGTGVAELGKGVLQGGANVLDHAADWAQSGLNAFGGAGDALNSVWGNGKNDLAGSFGDAPEGYEVARGAGRLGGEIGATLPLAAVRGGVMVQGALGGALLSDADTVGGVARDAIGGAVAGKAGERLIGGVAGAVAPRTNPEVAALANEGIRLTPGQIAGAGAPSADASVGGRTLKRTEDIVSSIPLAGGMVQAAQRRGVEDLNLAATNRALRPIQERLPKAIKAGHDAVRYAGDKLSAAYSDVLPKLAGSADKTFATRLRAIVKRADLPPGYEEQAQSVINEALKAFRPTYRAGSGAPRLTGPGASGGATNDTLAIGQESRAIAPAAGRGVSTDANGVGIDPNAAPTYSQFTDPGVQVDWNYNGKRLRDASERLGDLGAGFRANDDPYKRILGDIAQQARDQLHSLARRGNPTHAARLRDIDRGYASLVRVERAAAGTNDGVFTPRQYDSAVRMTDRSARRRQSARGRALDQDLSKRAVDIMGNTAAQGGSKDVNSLVALGLLGSRAVTGDLGAIAGLGGVTAGSALYSGPGQAAARALLTRNPSAQSQAIAALLRKGAAQSGIVAPVLIEEARQ